MSGAPPLQRPVFEPTLLFPELAQLAGYVARYDWPAVSGFFDQLAAQGDQSDQSYLAGIVAKIAGVERFLEEVVAREPTSTLAQVLLADRHIIMGWDVRTGSRAVNVATEQFTVFHDHLRRAERILIGVTAREPDNALAWRLRLTTALGLELGQGEARRRYDRLAAHHPHYFPGQTVMLQQLCPKWSGNWDDMHGFARDCAAAAPEGSQSPILVAEGYLERWLDTGGGQPGSDYLLRQLNLRHEITEAAQRSVLSPAFRSRYGGVSGHGTFAALFSLLGDHEKAAVHFRLLGNAASEYPWSYFGDPAASFERFRNQALGKG